MSVVSSLKTVKEIIKQYDISIIESTVEQATLGKDELKLGVFIGRFKTSEPMIESQVRAILAVDMITMPQLRVHQIFLKDTKWWVVFDLLERLA